MVEGAFDAIDFRCMIPTRNSTGFARAIQCRETSCGLIGLGLWGAFEHLKRQRWIPPILSSVLGEMGAAGGHAGALHVCALFALYYLLCQPKPVYPNYKPPGASRRHSEVLVLGASRGFSVRREFVSVPENLFYNAAMIGVGYFSPFHPALFDAVRK